MLRGADCRRRVRDTVRADGRVRSGDTVLLVGFGAGLSFAGQVVRFP